jgi:tetratricopeptide (TPR) repeat protein
VERAQRQHAAHYGRWLADTGRYFRGDVEQGGRRQLLALHNLRLELENIRVCVGAAASARNKKPLSNLAATLNAGLELGSEFLMLREMCQAMLRVTKRNDVRLQAQLGLATSLRRLGQPQPALNAAHTALQLAIHSDDVRLKVTALRTLAQCELAVGQNTEARAALMEALELSHPDFHEVAAVLNTLGTLDFRQGRHGEARQRLTRAAEILRGVGNPDAEARTLTNLGMLEVRHGNLDEARRLLDSALETAIALGNHREAAIRLANLGSIASDARDFAEARVFYRQALAQIQQSGERSVRATLLGNLGMVAREEHDYMLAATLLGQAYELHVELGNRLGQAEILRFMAIISLLQQDPREAALYLLRALEMSQEFGAGREIAVTAGLAGTLLARQGDLQRGAMLLHAALHQEELHHFRYEDDVRSILDDGLDEVGGRLSNKGLTAEDAQRAKDAAQSLGLDELGALTARTLRERFAWTGAAPRA